MTNERPTLVPKTASIGAPYLDYSTDDRVLVEGQIWVADTFDIDYVSAISDPAVEATDCGSPTVFFPDDPPANNGQTPLLGDKARLDHLELPPIAPESRRANRLRVIEGLKARVGERKLVEGWIEGPCAEAADLRGINTLMLDFYDDPDFVERLFDFVLALELDFAAAQVRAGADLIGIGDAAAPRGAAGAGRQPRVAAARGRPVGHAASTGATRAHLHQRTYRGAHRTRGLFRGSHHSHRRRRTQSDYD